MIINLRFINNKFKKNLMKKVEIIIIFFKNNRNFLNAKLVMYSFIFSL